MRRGALVLLLTLSGCAAFQDHGLKAVDAASCVVADETLSVAFKNPEKARAWLRLLSERLEDGDPKAVDDAAMLAKKLLECVP
jgi:hypothetical protein